MKLSWDWLAVAALALVLGSLTALCVLVPEARASAIPVLLAAVGAVVQAMRGRAVKRIPKPPTSASPDVH